MRPLTQVAGTAAILDRENVDTDQIIPKQFLKRIERSGFGEFLFFDWMRDDDFELRQPEAQGASILIAGANFGCGSSREHAPWALEDYGFRVILAPSYGDIFRRNSIKTGMAPIVLADDDLARVKGAVQADPRLAVDLETQVISHPGGIDVAFDFDPFDRHLLLNGLDDVALTLARADRIDTYEATHPGRYDSRVVTVG